jgi:hypothetical protein
MKELFPTILTAVIVAILGILGNITYFGFTSKKKKSKEITKERLTRLLLPLYYILKNDELEVHEWIRSDDADMYEYVSDLPKRVFDPLVNIINDSVYLADEELHKASVDLIEWYYKCDPSERFQRVHWENELKEDKTFENFREIVYRKYEQDRNRYLN